MLNFFFSFLLFFAFWIILSGKFDLFHLCLGFISCLIVSVWTRRLLFEVSDKTFLTRVTELSRFLVYQVWLFWQIVLANIHVIHLAFQPKVCDAINSHLVEFKTCLKSDIAKYVLANSITLTPGTITIQVTEDTFLVHAITRYAADGLPESFEKKIKFIFGADA